MSCSELCTVSELSGCETESERIIDSEERKRARECECVRELWKEREREKERERKCVRERIIEREKERKRESECVRERVIEGVIERVIERERRETVPRVEPPEAICSPLGTTNVPAFCSKGLLSWPLSSVCHTQENQLNESQFTQQSTVHLQKQSISRET